MGEVSSGCRGEIIKWSYKLAEDTLRQIIGRAIRRPDDSATVYVLDTSPKSPAFCIASAHLSLI